MGISSNFPTELLDLISFWFLCRSSGDSSDHHECLRLNWGTSFRDSTSTLLSIADISDNSIVDWTSVCFANHVNGKGTARTAESPVVHSTEYHDTLFYLDYRLTDQDRTDSPTDRVRGQSGACSVLFDSKRPLFFAFHRPWRQNIVFAFSQLIPIHRLYLAIYLLIVHSIPETTNRKKPSCTPLTETARLLQHIELLLDLPSGGCLY